MKKKLLTILLSVFMIMTSFTTRVFAGELGETKTIAQILATVEGFPTSKDSSNWKNEEKGAVLHLDTGVSPNQLRAAYGVGLGSSSNICSTSLEATLNVDNDYVYTITPGYDIKFVMTNDELTSIQISESFPMSSSFFGTFAPDAAPTPTTNVAKIVDTEDEKLYETLDKAIEENKNSLTLNKIIIILSTEDLSFTANLNIGEFFLVNDYTHVMYPEGYYCTPVTSSDVVVGYKIGPGITSITKNSTTTYYETLNKAITAAQNGDTVVLLKDLLDRTNTNEAKIVDKDITLDLNGHKIVGNYNNGGVINTYGNNSITTAHLTITDNSDSKGGSLENTNTGSTGCGIYQDGYSILTLSNVSIKGAYAGVIQSNSYASGNQLTVSTGASVTGTSYAGVNISTGYSGSGVIVDGGTITGGARGVMLGNSGASLTMNSGSITGSSWGVVASKNNCEININGGTVTGTSEYGIQAGTESYTKGIKVTIDGGTISGGKDGIYIYGKNNTATINDGLVSGSDYGIYVGSVTSGTGNSVTVAGGTVQATGNDNESAIGLWDGATLTMTNGTVENTDKGFAIANNGSNTVATTINISGGTVSAPVAGSTAIYQAGPGTTTISGTAEITGYDTGIEIRNGTLNVSGGSITSTVDTFSCNANGNGTTTVGAALAIAQHTTKKNITVEISGGTFKGIVPVNECNPQNNDPTPQITMTVSDGEFWSTATENAKVFSCADCDEFLTGGGFFTHVPELKYIAPGKVVRDTTADEKTNHGDHYLYTLGVIGELQNIIDEIIEEKQEGDTPSTIVVTNGDTPISAEIDDKIEIIVKKVPDGTGKDTNTIIAEPGYKMNEPTPKEDGNLSYTATPLDIGKDYLGGVDGSGKKDSKKTDTELKQAVEGATQAVKDSAKSVKDTEANKQLEKIVHDNLNTILSIRGIHQGTAAKALNKANINVTNDGSSGSTKAKNVNVYVLTYYDTEVLEDKTTQTNKSYKLDITPMYQAYASTAASKEVMITEGTGKDSVKIGDSLPVDCTDKTINLKIELPDGFITNTNQKVYVIHHSVNGIKTYNTTVTKESDKFYIEFTNPDGFSEFEITLKNPNPTPRYRVPNTSVEGVTNNHSLLKLSSLSLLAIGTYMAIKKKKDN